jgi:hypothetical protein
MTELSLCTFHPPFSSPLTNGTNTGSKSPNQTRIVDGEQDRFRRWKYFRTSGARYLGAPTTSGPSMKQQWINAKVVQASCVMYGRVKR